MDAREKLEERVREYGISLLKRQDLPVKIFREKLLKKILGDAARKGGALSSEASAAAEAAVEKVTASFLRLGYLDDGAYAEAFIRAHGYGAKKLAWALRQKGIDPELWTDKIAENKDRELAEIKRLAAKQQGKDRQKVIASLARRGFSLEDILKALSDDE
ncbi:MAG: RecX family transcriptional regulator [Fusobacteriaceae bacterium]|jgi:SOS response regulatory protein OraA/RecX|nr:RecX family transcriptional regulator [Fusobacteriaceae bacterium]